MDAVNLFLNLSTQWVRAGLSGDRTGINYGVVPAVVGMLKIKDDGRLLGDLRVMEHEALIRMAARA